MMPRLFLVLKYSLLLWYRKSIERSPAWSDVLYDGITTLGGVYVKLIQFMCLRTDVFPDSEKMRYLSFYDAVPFVPLPISDILNKELGAAASETFRSIDRIPFASGTFGQVYRATLTDGTDVIIKVKRPNLVRALRFDFLLLKAFGRFASFIYDQRILDVNALICEFEQSTLEELDYRREAEHAAYFYDIYKSVPEVLIPRTFPGLSTNRILVQEYVGGIALTDLIRMRSGHPGFDYKAWLRQTYRTDIYTIIRRIAFDLGIQGFVHELFYADPHPGNIKILPDNRYALIDFGIVGQSPRNRRNYYNIVRLMLDRADSMDMQGIGREFLEWGAGKFYRYIRVLDDHFSDGKIRMADLLTENYHRLLNEKRERFREIEQTEKENFVAMYLDIIKTGQFLNVRVPEGMLATMKTVAIYKSWVTFLEPDFHHMRETYRKILDVLDADTLINAGAIHQKEVTVEEAIEQVMDWMGTVAERDMPLYRKISRTLKEVSYV
ncbi:AarF/ABC1/UbiB kinase family protein [Patescibacteria group bacterium]|nr:AarF/ABC1/UbiB kinase family protein [Patescibacteria group bacterium]